MCLCPVFLCLSASISPELHARSLPIFVHVAYRLGSVFLRRGDKIPRGRGNFGGFSPPMSSIAFKTHTKTVEPNEMPFGLLAIGTMC